MDVIHPNGFWIFQNGKTKPLITWFYIQYATWKILYKLVPCLSYNMYILIVSYPSKFLEKRTDTISISFRIVLCVQFSHMLFAMYFSALSCLIYPAPLEPVSQRVMTSQVNHVVTHTPYLKTVKCIFLVYEFKVCVKFQSALWNST